MKVCRLIEDLIHLYFTGKVGSLCRLCRGTEWIPEKRWTKWPSRTLFVQFSAVMHHVKVALSILCVPHISVGIFQSCLFFLWFLYSVFSKPYVPKKVAKLQDLKLTSRLNDDIVSLLYEALVAELLPHLESNWALCSVFSCYF